MYKPRGNHGFLPLFRRFVHGKRRGREFKCTNAICTRMQKDEMERKGKKIRIIAGEPKMCLDFRDFFVFLGRN
jgi:hypothetical protein